ncbi:MAG: IS110 family transposase [Nanoarchaeota archaeon]|nr:IS110 family transposase [Nanoarchaeota archaeon]
MKTVGIDVAKDSHKVCILNEKKEKLITFNFKNSHLGLLEFNKILSRYDTEFIIGFESSGIYHHNILYHLKKQYKNIAVLNPKRIKAHRKSLGYEYKTDKIDAYIIADYIKERDLSNNILPDKYPLLKQLCRTKHKLTRQKTRLKNRIRGDLHILFPEYEKCFSDIFCKSSLNFLKHNINPKDIAKLNEQKIRDILIKTSKNTSYNHAKKILFAAKSSFGIPKEGLDIEVKLAIENLEILEKQSTLLENKIEYHFEKLFNPLDEVKGLTKLYAASIIAESGDINYFKNRGQYYNFTGLVPRYSQSGNFESKFNHINKCGSSYLRHYFFQAAISLKRHNSYFKDLFIKKNTIEKKSTDEAHIYCAKKLCYIIFKLLKSQEKFCPEKLVH